MPRNLPGKIHPCTDYWQWLCFATGITPSCSSRLWSKNCTYTFWRSPFLPPKIEIQNSFRLLCCLVWFWFLEWNKKSPISEVVASGLKPEIKYFLSERGKKTSGLASIFQPQNSLYVPYSVDSGHFNFGELVKWMGANKTNMPNHWCWNRVYLHNVHLLTASQPRLKSSGHSISIKTPTHYSNDVEPLYQNLRLPNSRIRSC